MLIINPPLTMPLRLIVYLIVLDSRSSALISSIFAQRANTFSMRTSFRVSSRSNFAVEHRHQVLRQHTWICKDNGMTLRVRQPEVTLQPSPAKADGIVVVRGGIPAGATLKKGDDRLAWIVPPPKAERQPG